jgi:uncharacterized membrane protein YraQ (UPF0718 family)
MEWDKEWKPLIIIAAVFLVCFFLPVGSSRFNNAVLESLYLVRWYAKEHVLLCLIPAFFIAGAIAVFISQASVMKYLGAKANRTVAYGVASVSGSILAVCSCTVLPLFAGIYKMGAGLGPASTFLYSGPAINVLAIILTARILGVELGVARALGAVLFSIIIGLLMHAFFRKQEIEKSNARIAMPEPEVSRPLWKNTVYFITMVAILIFASWSKPSESAGVWETIYSVKWIITGIAALSLAMILLAWYHVSTWKIVIVAILTTFITLVFPQHPIVAFSTGVIGLSIITSTTEGEPSEWFASSWGFAKQIIPLLFIGVIAAGLFLGRPGHEGLIPSDWVNEFVGGNSVGANFFAAVVGAFMYFATLTEVPILQGLIGNGMGKGPALALLLAGPAVSLPNMLVIRSVIGTRQTIVFVLLVIIMATVSGVFYGKISL